MSRLISTIFTLCLMLQTAASANPQPYPIDVVLPLTGPASFFGTSEKRGLEVYQDAFNKKGGIHGRPVLFAFHDDQGNPIVDTQIVTDLITKAPAVILGFALPTSCATAASLAAKGPVIYCLSPGFAPEPRGGFVFTSGATLQQKIVSALEGLRTLGYRRIALLTELDQTGLLNRKYAHDYFNSSASKGWTLVADEVHNPTDLGVTAQVSKIKAARPDVIMLWSSGAAFATAVRDLQNAGLDVTVATAPTNANPAQLQQDAAILPKTLVLTGLPYQGPLKDQGTKAAAQEYLSALKAANLPPSSIQAYAWDPMRIVLSSLNALPPNATASQLRDRIETTHGFGGLFGVYDFRSGDQHGLDGSGDPYVRWEASTQSWVYFHSGPGK